MDSILPTPAIKINVFGGSAGLIGRLASLTLGVLSAVKFLIATMKPKRSGTFPAKLTEEGCSPIVVKIALISSSSILPLGSPRIQPLESVIFPQGLDPSGTFERSS